MSKWLLVAVLGLLTLTSAIGLKNLVTHSRVASTTAPVPDTPWASTTCPVPDTPW